MHKKKRGKLKYIILLLVIALGIFGYFNYDVIKEKIVKKKYFPIVEETTGSVDLFTRYGRYFNISGSLDGPFDELNNVKIVFNNEEGDTEYSINYEVNDNGLTFKTNEKINEGINLDNVKIGNYYILLKVINNDNSYKYYSLKNNSKYDNLDYYTMTKNSKNNYIKINFTKEDLVSVFKINVEQKKLPNDVYDIVIDPGHGGADSGAVKDDIHESTLVLGISLDLKKELENLGYKVKLTRTGDYDPGEKKMDPYSKGGRAVVPNDVKAKYLFSIHLNSDRFTVKKGGVEVYMPSNADTSLAKSLADNIVKYAGTNYSPKESFRELDGVYMRPFLSAEINSMKEDANKDGYSMYTITDDTPYYYMLRETGGIITGAYVDGRNKDYSKNKYYDANYGVESYILELGYIINDTDLKNIQNNKDGYIKGIVETLKNLRLENEKEK